VESGFYLIPSQSSMNTASAQHIEPTAQAQCQRHHTMERIARSCTSLPAMKTGSCRGMCCPTHFNESVSKLKSSGHPQHKPTVFDQWWGDGYYIPLSHGSVNWHLCQLHPPALGLTHSQRNASSDHLSHTPAFPDPPCRKPLEGSKKIWW
jgi:hypothetical protein